MFIGREEELEILEEQAKKRSASLVAIRGRRRIGKSRLIDEFSKMYSKKYLFTGIPPTKGVTAQKQREEFCKQMADQGLPAFGTDWSDIFWILGKEAEKGKVLISFDEAAWMGSRDPAFLGKLKIAWDRYFEKNNQLVFIITSSVSSWLDKNILKSAGFFGRVDLTMTLKELPLEDCSLFWGGGKRISAYEKLKVLAVVGGVPKYLNAINPKRSAEENIRSLCFTPHGILYNEFDRIFHDLFRRRSDTYKKIIHVLSDHPLLSRAEICKKLQLGSGRAISEYLSDLVSAGFLSADYTWSIQNARVGKLKKYRISDNYIRFYMKYIEPNKHKIEKGLFKDKSLFSSLQWETMMGLQFENLIIHNHHYLYKPLKIDPADIILEGPYFQTKTTRQKGCQIDYFIQAKASLYVCEVKFSKRLITSKVIAEVEEKIARLKMPRHYSYRPVLIHAGDVSDEVIEADYFDYIVDATKFLG